ncbi:Camelysin metallo-endopeptidase [Pseudarthrobacter equi]|uniref:Camelysin metallo-endopeptidase n=1 Tax=Pseudarthrobacter equi TaxID=728066 RepID=A0A1H2B3Y7_9MICC|nr:TasA family protein [Pseudarthrobacter equi]SDT52506.1 Camelysin metallo-endopeptidase [Pseudarthrobacter equi]
MGLANSPQAAPAGHHERITIMGLNLKSTTGKVLASTALVAAAASVAGLGTYGAFTSTTSASETVASGTVNVALGATGAANRLSVAASGLVAGDTVQRAVTLSNTGNQNLSAITLTTAASPSSKLDTDTVNGLQLTVDACSVPWTEAGTSPAFTYTCSGTVTQVLAPRAAVGANMALAGLNSVTSAAADNLRVTVTLPSSADNTFQGLSSTVGFSFTGTQRTATSK